MCKRLKNDKLFVPCLIIHTIIASCLIIGSADLYKNNTGSWLWLLLLAASLVYLWDMSIIIDVNFYLDDLDTVQKDRDYYRDVAKALQEQRAAELSQGHRADAKLSRARARIQEWNVEIKDDYLFADKKPVSAQTKAARPWVNKKEALKKLIPRRKQNV